jgi:ATP-binding cassette subfamily A (ABC1) protein 1
MDLILSQRYTYYLSIVLTSHSMEECEALCTKLVIMVNGKFKCIGSLQHLKSRFGKGYVVMIKLKPSPHEDIDPPAIPPMVQVKEFMSGMFAGCEVIEEHQGFVKYHIESSSTRLSEMFGALEENASRLNIVDYSVSQTTLDQIFVKFAKEQHSEERKKGRTCCSCLCC